MQTVNFDHLAAKALTVRNNNLGAGDFFALRLACQLVIGIDPGFLLGLTRFLPLTHPFQFALKGFLFGLIFPRFLRKALGLLLKPAGIVALIRNAASAIEFQNPAGDIIQKIPVVGHDQDGAFIVDQMLLQPSDGFRIQMVCRFIQQQHFRRFQQQFTQRHTAPFTARKRCHIRLIRRAAQRLHRDIYLAVQIPEVFCVDLILQLRHFIGGFIGIIHRQLVIAIQNGFFLGHAQHHVFAHIQAVIQMRLLRQIAHLGALGGPGFAGKVLIKAGHDFHQRRFTGAIDPDNTDFHAGQKR